MYTKQTYIYILITIAVVVGAVVYTKRLSTGEETSARVSPASLDAFAQCLAEKNVTMYGAEWCSHCKKQKAMFGSSFSYVPYVECPDNIQACLAKGIQGYPTWIGPDRVLRTGEQELSKLAEISGCSL